MKKITIFSLIVFIIDQISKLVITFNMKLNTSLTVIKKFFALSHVHNYGAAFSFFYGSRIFLIIVSLLVLFLIYHYLIKNNIHGKLDTITYSLLIGGIVGNLFDRIVYGYVIDFFDFNIFGYDFPIFNVADICIVLSVILLIIGTFVGEKNENTSRK